jgi:hypothetical protein
MGISPSQGRYLHTEQKYRINTHTSIHVYRTNTHIQASMFGVGFEPTIPVFERAKMVHALDRAATVIGFCD